MKIIFICGSLDPGRDGVGDYVRRLAIELIKQGYQTAAVAINDQYISTNINGTQKFQGIDVPVLRIPSVCSNRDRILLAKKWINAFEPQLLSLQYVPFAFQIKGLPFGLHKLLVAIAEERPWHIMFHELWVGMAIQSSIKHILWGKLQRFLIQSLVFKLKPHVIHTQTNLYRAQLAKINIKASVLPLFSNIPRKNYKPLNFDVKKDSSRSNKKKIVIVLFGTLNPYSEVETFITEVAFYKKREGAEILFQAVGRCGTEIERWISACKSKGLRIDVLGELPSEDISEILHNASLGIATTVLPLIEKSGTVAAMREHGVPVMCIARPWKSSVTEVLKQPRGIFEFGKATLEECLDFRNNNSNSSAGVLEVCLQFIEDNDLKKL